MDSNPLNPDGTANAMYYKFYTYHVPTNFEVITFTKELGRGWRLETKPYTYSYSNHQHLFKNQSQDLTGNSIYAPVSVKVTSTSAVDKLNQYNRGGEITTVSSAASLSAFSGPAPGTSTPPRIAISSRPTRGPGWIRPI